MRRYHSWLVAVGIATATPGITLAGPWGFGKKADAAPAAESAPASQGRPSNQQVAQKIAGALKDAGLSGNRIEIAYQNGVAILNGSVKTPEQKATASAAVSRVPGVRQVDNRLQTGSKQPARPDMARKAPPRNRVQQVQYEQAAGGAAEQGASSPNQQMAENIATALRQARFQGYEIEIAYDGGTAVLRGAVAHPQAKMAATSIVQQVAGVERVENQLSVIPARPAQYAQPPAQYGPQAGPYGPPPAQYGPAPEGMAGPGMAPNGYCPPGAQGAYGPMPQGPANGAVYDQPMMGENAWPSYAQHPNYAAVTYPKQYAASAWPYIGPFYPYPQVPMGWRKATLEWDDGYWNLSFSPRTDRWWWFLNPNNW